MKKRIFLFQIILLLFLISCSSKIETTKHIDINAPFILTISSNDGFTGLSGRKVSSIDPASQKHQKFIKWINENSDGWKSTFASYLAEVSITQNDFRLLYYADFVVIAFNDGEARQYFKSITNGELDFLIDDLK